MRFRLGKLKIQRVGDKNIFIDFGSSCLHLVRTNGGSLDQSLISLGHDFLK
jgi:hypothetical protein